MGLLLFAAVVALCVVAWIFLRGSRERELAAEAVNKRRLQDVSPAAGDAWRDLLGAEGLGTHVAALEPQVHPAIRLTATPSGAQRAGESRIGGRPDLPSDVSWPTYADLPLGFLAQVDLAALPAGTPLPPDGYLWFFYVADQSTWGFDPKDAGSARVFYGPAGVPLSPAEPPAGMPDGGEYPACALAFEAYRDLPDLDTDHPVSARLNEEEHERYQEIRDYLASGGGPTAHKLLGHAQPVQGAMELECALVTHGLYCGDRTGYEDPRAAEAGKQAERWRLLLQLDTDDGASMMWGDVGRLYFWIREDDLQARRFDRTWTILQCH